MLTFASPKTIQFAGHNRASDWLSFLFERTPDVVIEKHLLANIHDGGRVKPGTPWFESEPLRKQFKAQAGQVVVLMGGHSAEREISLKSGQAVLNALIEEGIAAKAFDPAVDDFSQLNRSKVSRAFIALHGRGGEDGSIQGFLETQGIPYTGSGVLASALAIDKLRTKQLWFAEGLPTPAFVEIKTDDDIKKAIEQIGFPCIVKPSREGSSLGITKVSDSATLYQAIKSARDYDTDIMVESWIEGDEYTVGILGDGCLPAIRIETPQELYNFNAKYEADSTQFFCPCGLTETEESSMQDIAYKAFKDLGCRSWGRVDLIRDKAGVCWLLEVNTVPGLTNHSLVPMAAEGAKMTFNELILCILADAVCDKPVEQLCR